MKYDASYVYSNETLIDHYSSFDNLFSKEIDIFENVLKKSTYKTALDIGCGTGRITNVLFRLGFDVTGIDLSEKMINAAKIKYPNINFKLIDITTFPFSEKAFDIIFFAFNGIDFIYPFTKRIQVLEYIFKLLVPGGIFIYSSHNSACILTKRKSRIKNLLLNTIQLRIFSHYRKNIDITEGTQIICHQNPLSQKRILSRTGFTDITIYSNFNTLLEIFFRDYWPYYSAIKPKNWAKQN